MIFIFLRILKTRADHEGMPAAYVGKLLDSSVGKDIRVVYPRLYGKGHVNGKIMSIIGGGMIRNGGNALNLPGTRALTAIIFCSWINTGSMNACCRKSCVHGMRDTIIPWSGLRTWLARDAA